MKPASRRSSSSAKRGSARRPYGRLQCGAGDELGFPVLSARPAESESRLSFAGLTDLLVAVDPGCSRDAAPASGGGTRCRPSPRRREASARTPARRNRAPVSAPRAHLGWLGARRGRRRAVAGPAVGLGARVRTTASRRPARTPGRVAPRGCEPPGLRRCPLASARTRAALGRRAPTNRQREARRHVFASDARAPRRGLARQRVLRARDRSPARRR